MVKVLRRLVWRVRGGEAQIHAVRSWVGGLVLGLLALLVHGCRPTDRAAGGRAAMENDLWRLAQADSAGPTCH